MVFRTSLGNTHSKSRSTVSRATVREFDDNHLIQQVKKADVYHSETPSDFERFQMVGLTSMPLKQEDQQQQQGQQGQSQSQGGDGGENTGEWNHNQPQGKAAEAVMLYLNGHRSHPIAIVDDRRVRPYAMKEGETALYAASGTGQMVFHNDKGSYLIAVNNPPEQSQNNQETERYASLRHVNKQKQSRQIQQSQQGSGSGLGGSDSSSQQQQDPHHEGETINAEVRCTKDKIEFRIGDKVVAYIDKDKFVTQIETRLGDENATNPVYGNNGGKGMTTIDKGQAAVLVKATQPGPPTSLDQAP